MREYSALRQVTRVRALDSAAVGGMGGGCRLLRMERFVENVPTDPSPSPHEYHTDRHGVERADTTGSEQQLGGNLGGRPSPPIGSHVRQRGMGLPPHVVLGRLDTILLLGNLLRQSFRSFYKSLTRRHAERTQPQARQGAHASVVGEQVIIQNVPGSPPEARGAHAYEHMLCELTTALQRTKRRGGHARIGVVSVSR